MFVSIANSLFENTFARAFFFDYYECLVLN